MAPMMQFKYTNSKSLYLIILLSISIIFSFYEKQIEELLYPPASLNEIIKSDLKQISNSPNLIKFWEQISEFNIIFSPVEIKENIRIDSVELEVNRSGALIAELNFINSNKNDPLIILQISIFDKKTKNKILEFSRSYSK